MAFQAENSFRLAARELADSNAAFLVICEGRQPIGILDQRQVAKAVFAGASDLDPVRQWVAPIPVTLLNSAKTSEAWEVFSSQSQEGIVVVDEEGAFVGIVTPARLVVPDRLGYRPRQVGGMATPFGVYLTDGNVGAGVPGYALVSTGVLLGTLLLGSALLTHGVNLSLPDEVAVIPWVQAGLQGLTLVIFLVAIRLLPLSGIHAAEHMVVHAIERGEELEVENVARMPRVHPRCGTNIAAAASLFLGIFLLPFGTEDVRLLLAVFVTLFLWRPLGTFMQSAITTRPPTRRQVALGVKAGKELLEKASVARRTSGNLLTRLWASGLFHVLAGKFLVGVFVMLYFVALDGPKALRVLFGFLP